VENEVAFECMRVAYEKGCNFFDSAEVYAAGQSEIVMGQAIKKFGWERSSLIISTKLYWGGNKPNERGLSRKHIVEGLTASLERLQLSYVDLVFAHRPDDLTSMEHIVRAFNWCVDQGLCFYWGTSEWSAEQISDAHRIAEKLGLMGPSFEQPQYNMLHRERFEVEYAPLYRKWNLGTTIWSPLASGILTGKYLNGIPEDSRLKTMKNDFIRNRLVSGLQSEEGKAKQAKVAKLMEIGKELNCSVSNLALAWCMKNPNVSSVITGASKVSQVLITIYDL
jgi:voltage-dependent potassium channel beta subunit